MKFEWDERKARSNLAKHGIDFVDAGDVFSDPNSIIVDVSRAGDGESRNKAIGYIAGRLVAVVFTRRQERLRLISARRANPPEQRRYADRAV